MNEVPSALPSPQPGRSFSVDARTVLTPDGPLADASLVVEDGLITFVGHRHDMSPEHSSLPRHFFPSSALVPGFVDCHSHVTQAFAKTYACGEPAQIWKRMWVPLSGSLDEEAVYQSAKWTAVEMLRGGFTTAVVAGEPYDDRGRAALRGMLETGIRVVFAFGFSDAADYHTRIRPQHPQSPATEDCLAAAEKALGELAGRGRVSASLACGTVHSATPDLLAGISQLAASTGALFQFHANEHTAEVEYSLDQYRRRPIELLADLGALGPHVLLAHTTLVTPSEITLLAETDTAVSYNPVASAWKGNAVAPALHLLERGIRVGLGTDATRHDGFRLLDAAETAQRLTFSLAVDDFDAGAGLTWVHAATAGGAAAAGQSDITGALEAGKAADFLILEQDTFETTPAWDYAWNLVRYHDRTTIRAVYVDGILVLDRQDPVLFDAEKFFATAAAGGSAAMAAAPVYKVHRHLDDRGTVSPLST